MNAMSLISRNMEFPRSGHWQVGKMTLRYIARTINFAIFIHQNQILENCMDTQIVILQVVRMTKKKTSGYVFSFGLGVATQVSKKKPIVMISLVEVEYVATTLTTCQSVQMRHVLSNLQHEKEKPTQNFYDKISTTPL